MLLIGHRGVMDQVPQNTLESIDKAIRGGVTMVEFDVSLSKDGKVILFHDGSPDQISRNSVSGKLTNFTFDELRKINVHDGFDDGKIYQIPTLEEALDLISKLNQELKVRTRINVELKAKHTAEPTFLVLKTHLEKGFEVADFIVSSFRHNELAKFKRLMPEMEIGYLVNLKQWSLYLHNASLTARLAKRMGAVCINPNINFVSKKLVEKAHEAGLKVNVWQVKTQADWDKLEALGVDGAFCNTLNLNRG